MFDDGYEAYREWVLPRMIEKGILPPDTALTEINPMPDGTYSPNDEVRPWASLNDDEKRLFSRMAEVYAGFSEYTDAQVGRTVDYLEESGQLDNTIIFYCADNGASGEGSPNGSVNEGKFFNGYPDTIEDNLPLLDRLGTRTPTTTTRPAGRRRSPRPTGCQALHLPGRGVRPAGDPLAGRDRVEGRGPPPVPPRDRHRPDDPRRVRRRVAGPLTPVRCRTRCPGSHPPTASTRRPRPTEKHTQYYEMFGLR